jgi:hypothetical protein
VFSHSVPSWSNSAIRSAGSTKFGFDWSVVSRTNFRMASLAAPSCQEGKGSLLVWAFGEAAALARTAAENRPRVTRRVSDHHLVSLGGLG